jgi:group II intron reverse transcriptase/maturase
MAKRKTSKYDSLKVHKKFKIHSLTGRIDSRLLIRAWKAVRRNRGAAGVDRVSIRMFEANLRQNLLALMKQLKTGSYRSTLLRRTHIPKGSGSKDLRPLGIPTVRDRIAQEVVRRLIEPIFEPQFHDASYGFRKFRNAHQAIQRLLALRTQGFHWTVDADIKGFFDNIEHDLIMHLIRCDIADGKVLDHLESFLRSGVLEDGVPRPTLRGTPQGGVISPLLANVVLNHLDWRLHHEDLQFVRYADDFVVLCQTQDEAEKALAFTQRVIQDELDLLLHPDKTRIASYAQSFDFLGFSFSKRFCVMRPKAVERFKANIREITTRHRNLDDEVITKLNRLIRGSMNYFGAPFAAGHDLFEDLDQFVRRRVRSMKYKRISMIDNQRLHNSHIANAGVLSCLDIFRANRRHPTVPDSGQSQWGRPVREIRTPVNVGSSPHRDNGEGEAQCLTLTH